MKKAASSQRRWIVCRKALSLVTAEKHQISGVGLNTVSSGELGIKSKTILQLEDCLCIYKHCLSIYKQFTNRDEHLSR